MKGKAAGFIFTGICIILALLLLAKIIEIIAAAILFAVALIILGTISKNFRK